MSAPRRLRAPREDGAVVADPPLAQAGSLVASNRDLLASGPAILGVAWGELRRRAGRETQELARDYLSGAGEPLPGVSGAEPIIMAGHQPELFHPGVWVKNFALNAIARRVGAVPLNLVVDNDTAKATALRVPAPPNAEASLPHVVNVPFDRWEGEVPYEERPVHDETLFGTLPERVQAVFDGWNLRPVLHEYWGEVSRASKRTPLLGERLAAGRRALERCWGCSNLEIPISVLCRSESFAWFACHLLAELPRFHTLYNACVHAYREQYGIRSRNHPVPDLGRDGDWLELPFWAWRSGQTRRGRPYARATATGFELRVGGEAWPGLPPARDPSALVEAWRRLAQQGYKFRSRALTNTLFARLFVADLFLHGIGGGKYDELTDAIAERFYGVRPPAFQVLTATLLLPLPTHDATPSRQRELARARRDLFWNPQRHLPDGTARDPRVATLVSEKERLVATAPAVRDRRERFTALRHLTEALRPAVATEAVAVTEALETCERGLEANAVLRRRDFAFCLYPESVLRPFCARFLS